MNDNITQPNPRRDGNAAHYPYLPEAPHYIEQSVTVYLRLDDTGTHWIVDGASVDGYPLYSGRSDEDATNEECACDRPDECDAQLDMADKLPLPTAEELAELILDALPG
ncbi:hypothetical protein [Mycolicibacterium llatzerense]|uniref:hypothetical protein n=1 Tax=Mycolicibacterium llatzerense TaxID=280871 RepID=UPI001F218129|nr:hypothetical protein [Mycolicibacterium llatzerense]